METSGSSECCPRCTEFEKELAAALAASRVREEEFATLLDELVKQNTLLEADLERYKKASAEPARSSEENRSERLNPQVQQPLDLILPDLDAAVMNDTTVDPGADDNADQGEDSSSDNGNESGPKGLGGRDKGKKKRKKGRRKLQDEALEEIVVELTPDAVTAAEGEGFKKIGEEVSYKIAYRSASWVRLKVVRAKYLELDEQDGNDDPPEDDDASQAPSLSSRIVIAPIPASLLPHAQAEASAISQVIVSKYEDFLPLARQERISERHGFRVPKSTQCSWLTLAHKLCAPVVSAMFKEAKATAYCLQTDATGARVRYSDRKKEHDTKRRKDQEPKPGPSVSLCAHRGDTSSAGCALAECSSLVPDAGGGDHGPRDQLCRGDNTDQVSATDTADRARAQPERTILRERCDSWHLFVFVSPGEHVVFRHTEKHTSDAIEQLLDGYSGYLLSDAHSIYDRLHCSGGVVEVACWAHTRRYFTKALNTDRLAAEHAVLLIGMLFKIDKTCWEQAKDIDRFRDQRARNSRPVLERIDALVHKYQTSADPGGPLAAALTYYTNQRDALRRFLEDGRLLLDNNESERQLRRPIKGRDNWHYFENETGAAWFSTFASLLASCRIFELDPQLYLTELIRLMSSWPPDRMMELAPKYWTATRSKLTPEQLATIRPPWLPYLQPSAPEQTVTGDETPAPVGDSEGRERSDIAS